MTNNAAPQAMEMLIDRGMRQTVESLLRKQQAFCDETAGSWCEQCSGTTVAGGRPKFPDEFVTVTSHHGVTGPDALTVG